MKYYVITPLCAMLSIAYMFSTPILAETFWRWVGPDGKGVTYTNIPDAKCRVGYVSAITVNLPELPSDQILRDHIRRNVSGNATEGVSKTDADDVRPAQNEDQFARERAAKEVAERARQQAEAAKKLKDEYVVKIKSKIEQNTFAPEGLTGNPRAEFKIVLLPTSEAFNSTLIKSSGNPAYDEAVERSIYKSAPLPLPPNNPEFFRELRELRLPFTYTHR